MKLLHAKILLVLVIVLCAAAAGVWIGIKYARTHAIGPAVEKTPPELVLDFVREARQLAAMTEQGVANKAYCEQLTKTKVACDLADPFWPVDDELEARSSLKTAVFTCELARWVWDLSKRRDAMSAETNATVIARMEELAPGQVIYNEAGAAPYDKNIRMLMALAGEYFRTGLKFYASPLLTEGAAP